MRLLLVFVTLSALAVSWPLRAQMQLPGALQTAPPTASKATPPAAAKKIRPVGLKAPAEASVLGRELSLDGAAGAMVLGSLPGSGLAIMKLSLPGESLSNPADECRVDVVDDKPIAARLAGRPNGATRYEAGVAACPFFLDVLEGAVLVSLPSGDCSFTAAQCKVHPAGLWGPAGNTIGAGQAKQIERERSRAESNMRTNFRALIASAGKDREAVKRIAGEQAAFSSERETACRKYLKEEDHGFCALKLTQARALALEAQFAGLAEKHRGGSAQAAPQKAKAKKSGPPGPIGAKVGRTPQAPPPPETEPK